MNSNKIWSTYFVRMIAGILLLWVIYVVAVFLVPDFSDKYGNSSINAKIRDIKNFPLRLYSPDGTIHYSPL